MKKSDSDKNPKTPKFDIEVNYFDHIKKCLEKGEYIDGEFLSKALRNDHHFNNLDPIILKYLCDYLDGKIKLPRGKKPEDGNLVNRRNMFIRYKYARCLKWLQNRRKKYGHLKGWPMLHEADFWQGPPNERAARMAARRHFHGAESYRRIQNIISSQK